MIITAHFSTAAVITTNSKLPKQQDWWENTLFTLDLLPQRLGHLCIS